MRYIEQWCDDAVSYIRFKPDRAPVKQELMEHMQDKYEDYVEQGMKTSDAERKTVAEMGDSRATGLLLRKIHKPYLGWFWRATQWVLVLLLIVAVVNGVQWGKDLWFAEPTYATYDPYEDTAYVFENGDRRERLFYLEPDSSARCNGYTFTVSKAAYWEGTHSTPLAGEVESNSFYFRLEVFNSRPWVGDTDAPRWMYAVDSLGNYYYSQYEHSHTEENYDEPYVWGNVYSTKPFTRVWDMNLENFVSRQAEWVDLYYERGGMEFTLRIDLTGGEGA